MTTVRFLLYRFRCQYHRYFCIKCSMAVAPLDMEAQK